MYHIFENSAFTTANFCFISFAVGKSTIWTWYFYGFHLWIAPVEITHFQNTYIAFYNPIVFT